MIIYVEDGIFFLILKIKNTYEKTNAAKRHGVPAGDSGYVCICPKSSGSSDERCQSGDRPYLGQLEQGKYRASRCRVQPEGRQSGIVSCGKLDYAYRYFG